MNKKTVIVTGGNVGLGYGCAQNILKAGPEWTVVIASRNKQRIEEAVNKLRREVPNGNVVGMTIDLGSLESIRQFVDEFRRIELPPLFGIVCNAGLQMVSETTYTTDGFETTFGVNHLGHYLLTNLLLPTLMQPGRIVFVSSDVHNAELKTGMPTPQYTTPEDLAYPKAVTETKEGELGRIRYSTSKLCNLYCTYEMDSRLKAKGIPITVNAFNPGMMPGSGLARDYSPFLRFMWNYVLPVMTLFSNNVRTTSRSGRDLARLILDPQLANVSGRYFDGARDIRSSTESYRTDRAEHLWKESSRLVSLQPHEAFLG